MNRIGKFLIVAIALAVILFLGYQVQLIRSIAVVGNRNLTSDEIIRQSGVHAGDSLLLTPESRIRDNLEKSRYIEYKRRGFDYRGTLTLTIRERLPAAYVNVLGIYYAIDTTGIVLDICGDGGLQTGGEKPCAAGPYAAYARGDGRDQPAREGGFHERSE